MAKGNMLLGQARGSVGDVTFTRQNGQQVIKAKTSVVKNPRTDAQVLQRIVYNTIAQAYSKMIAICDHSLEGVQIGMPTQSSWASINLKALRSRVVRHRQQYNSLSGLYSFSPISSKIFALNPYIMSVGSLPNVKVDSIDMSTIGEEMAVIIIPGAPESLTYESLANAFGLTRGDQLTFCNIGYTEGDQLSFAFCRVILDPTNEDGTPAEFGEPIFVDGEINLPADRNNGSFARVSYADGKLYFSVVGSVPVGACVITSRESSDGTWLRSSTTMAVVADAAQYEQYSMLECMDMFNSGGISFDSPYYLNNADNLNQNGKKSAPVAVKPAFQSFTVNGSSCMSPTAAAINLPTDNLDLQGVVLNVSGSEECRLVITSRALNVNSAYVADATADNSVAWTGATLNQQHTLTISGQNLNTYLVVGGIVIKRYGRLSMAVPASVVQLSALTVDGHDVLASSSSATVNGGFTLAGTLDRAPGSNVQIKIGSGSPMNITQQQFTMNASGFGRITLLVDGETVQTCGEVASDDND